MLELVRQWDWRARFGWAICIFFFPFVCLIHTPLDIFTENLETWHFGFPIRYVAFGAFSFPISYLIAALLPLRMCRQVALIGFWVAAFSLISSTLGPIKTSDAVGRSESATALVDWADYQRDAMLVVALVALAWLLARKKADIRILPWFAGFFVVIQMATLGGRMTSDFAQDVVHAVIDNDSDWHIGAAATKPPPTKGNIYHIMTDQLSSYIVSRALDEGVVAPEDFPGFNHFYNNRSNYDVTGMSVFSFLSGTMYTGGSMKAWRRQSLRDGLWHSLREEGWRLWLYPAGGHYETAIYDYRKKGAGQDQWTAQTFDYILALRLLPSWVRGAAEAMNPFPAFSKILTAEGVSPELGRLREYIADEKLRPAKGQVAYIHAYIPHGPFQLDRNCQRRATEIMDPEDAYREQAYCVITVLRDFVTELKRLGRYDDATIVVHGDHGGYGVYGPPLSVPEAQRNAAFSLPLVGLNRAEQLDIATAAGLLIKAPGANSEPLHRNGRNSQLLDIPATILNLVRADGSWGTGRPLLSDDYADDERREIGFGFMQYDPVEKTNKTFGRQIFKGRLHHLTWDSQQGWRKEDDLNAQW